MEINDEKKFSCSIEEWWWARYYSALYHIDGGIYSRLIPYDSKKWKSLLSLIYFGFIPLFIIFLFNDNLLSFLSLVGLTFYIAYRYFYGDHKEELKKSYLNATVQGNKIDFITLTDEGFYVNEFNDNNPDVLPFVKWSSVHTLEFSYANCFIGSPGVNSKSTDWYRLHRYIEFVKQKYPPYSIKPKLLHNKNGEERFALEMKIGPEGEKHQTLDRSRIAIPNDWVENGKMKELILTFEELSGKKVQLPPRWGIKLLDSLNDSYENNMN
ncbi:hypothetical protein ACFSCX_06860 [Bacillus salitolerans]|uniref:Uncharacterized protein n=1 Tax=Bacillus salitolerans TaxID=1437434 RepID=A0ABW4LQ96_9BACI